MGRTGAVRGDGVETEPLLTVDGWFDIGPLKQGKKHAKPWNIKTDSVQSSSNTC